MLDVGCYVLDVFIIKSI